MAVVLRGVVLTEEAGADVLVAEAAGVSLEGTRSDVVAACEVLSLLLLLVAGACEVGAGSSEVGAGSSVVEAGGAAEDAGGALDAGGGDDVSGAAEGVGDGVGVGVGVGELLPVPWAWRFSFWWRYSLMPSMCRPSKLKAEAMATRASRANNHVWRIMVSVSVSMSMWMSICEVHCRNGRLQIKRRRMGVGQIRCG